MKWLKIKAVLLSTLLFCWVPLSQADIQFRVIVDASGSMLISDPDRLTSEALRLIANLAPEEETTLGVWLFGEAPRVLFTEALLNKETKAKLANYMDNYITQDVKTDLEAIIEVLLETPDLGNLAEGYDRHWILVTDGMVDISLDEAINTASRDRILNDLTKQLEENNIHLHAVSMTVYTDRALLESLSLRTSATHTEIAIPEDLLATFDRIFTQASPSNELPFDGNRFVVDEAIDELTLVVFHEHGVQPYIIEPNGNELSLVDKKSAAVSVSDHYTLITISTPDSGEWQINNVNLERSRIRVITNLSAQATKVSPVVFVNEDLYSTVGLFQNDVLITDDKILDLLTIKQTLLRLNGEKKKPILSYEMTKENSQFKQNIEGIIEPGNYELMSLVDGKTFSRQVSQYFTVHPAINFIASSPGSNLIAFLAKPVNLKLNILRSNVVLEYTYDDGIIDRQDMPLIGQGYWEKVVLVPPSGNVKVRAKLAGVTQTGLRFDYWTSYWHFFREEGGEVKIVPDENVPTSVLLTPVTTSTDDVMPVLVPPAISIVSEVENNQDVVLDQTLPFNPEIIEVREEVSMSYTKWIMYVVLSLGGLLIIGGVFLYRLLKKNKPTKDDDIYHV